MQDIQAEISKILAEYGNEVVKEMRPAIEKVAKEGVKKLKSTSPKSGKSKRKYANGWRAKSEVKRFGAESIVYNATKPGLTHLLEHGHAKVGGGRVAAIPHIQPVDEWISKEVVTELQRRLSK